MVLGSMGSIIRVLCIVSFVYLSIYIQPRLDMFTSKDTMEWMKQSWSDNKAVSWSRKTNVSQLHSLHDEMHQATPLESVESGWKTEMIPDKTSPFEQHGEKNPLSQGQEKLVPNNSTDIQTDLESSEQNKLGEDEEDDAMALAASLSKQNNPSEKEMDQEEAKEEEKGEDENGKEEEEEKGEDKEEGNDEKEAKEEEKGEDKEEGNDEKETKEEKEGEDKNSKEEEEVKGEEKEGKEEENEEKEESEESEESEEKEGGEEKENGRIIKAQSIRLVKVRRSNRNKTSLQLTNSRTSRRYASKEVTLKKRRSNNHLYLSKEPIPMRVYDRSDYPPDHISDRIFRKKIDMLIAEEGRVIYRLAVKRPYRSAFYSGYLVRHTTLVTVKGYSIRKLNAAHLETLRTGLMKGVNNDAYVLCDGCKTSHKQHITMPTNVKEVRKFIGDREVDVVESPYPPASAPFDVTIVMVASLSRVFVLPQTLSRWPGYEWIYYYLTFSQIWNETNHSQFTTRKFVLVVTYSKETETELQKWMSTTYFPERVTILAYYLQDVNYFPINKLRNLGIRHIRTTHFMVLDVDLMVSKNLYSEIMKLPERITSDTNNAVILPVFFYNRDVLIGVCRGLKTCISMYVSTNDNEKKDNNDDCFQFCIVMDRGIDLIPENKTDLVSCLNTRLCLMRKKWLRTHIYVMPDWFTVPTNSHVSKMKCFFADFMEPYVMLRYAPSTPLFAEQFFNYGYNKVQHIEHLRAANFQFYILNHAFAMDMPHPNSKFKEDYKDTVKKMYSLYQKFQVSLNKRYNFKSRFPLCPMAFMNTMQIV